MFILQGKIVFFGREERQRGLQKGGGTYEVFSVNAIVEDASGTPHFCDGKAAFGARVSCQPREGDLVQFVVAKCDFTMPKGVIEFSDILPVSTKAKA